MVKVRSSVVQIIKVYRSDAYYSDRHKLEKKWGVLINAPYVIEKKGEFVTVKGAEIVVVHCPQPNEDLNSKHLETHYFYKVKIKVQERERENCEEKVQY